MLLLSMMQRKEDYRQTDMNLLWASNEISSRICVTSVGSSDWEQSCRLVQGFITPLFPNHSHFVNQPQSIQHLTPTTFKRRKVKNVTSF